MVKTTVSDMMDDTEHCRYGKAWMIIGKNKTQNKNKVDDMRRKAVEWSLEMFKQPKRDC